LCCLISAKSIMDEIYHNLSFQLQYYKSNLIIPAKLGPFNMKKIFVILIKIIDLSWPNRSNLFWFSFWIGCDNYNWNRCFCIRPWFYKSSLLIHIIVSIIKIKKTHTIPSNSIVIDPSDSIIIDLCFDSFKLIIFNI